MDNLTWQAWGFGFVEMSTATESKQTLAALRGAHFDQNGRDVRGKATAVLLAIGISQRGFDFHYRKKYARAG